MEINRGKINPKIAVILLISFFVILVTGGVVAPLIMGMYLQKSTIESGVLITEVIPGSPAENILKTGEVIQRINDEKISTTNDFFDVFNKLNPGETVSIETDVSPRRVTLIGNPYDPGRPFLGVRIQPVRDTSKFPFSPEEVMSSVMALFYVVGFGLLFAGIKRFGPGTVLLSNVTIIAVMALLLLTNIGRVQVPSNVNPSSPEFVFAGIFITILLFIVPVIWIKKDEERLYFKAFAILTVSFFVNTVFLFYTETFELIRVLLYPIYYGFLFGSLWVFSRILRRGSEAEP
jgi:hypothetical protein